jgi:hypothetical protein
MGKDTFGDSRSTIDQAEQVTERLPNGMAKWQSNRMNGFTGVLIKFGVRLIVFGLVFWLVSKRNKDVIVHKRLAVPLIAFLFAALNMGLYFILKFVLNLATLNSVSLLMPLVINLIVLAVTIRIIERKKWLEIKGVIATVYLGLALTLVHGVLWFALDYLPKNV